MIIKNLLLSIDAGLGHHETSYFPVPIFKMKAGVNYNPQDRNYDLFKLALKVSAKRLFPCFSNLDAPFNAQYYKEGRPETEVAYMGCVDEDEVMTIGINGVRRYIRMSDFVKVFEECKASGTPIKVKDTLSKGWVNVLDCIDNGEEASSRIGWYEITFNDGAKIFCTADHPLPVLTRDNNGGEYKFYRADELMEGMRVKRAHRGTVVDDSKHAWIDFADLYMLGIIYARGTMSAADVRYSGDIRTSDMRYYMLHVGAGTEFEQKLIEASCFRLIERTQTKRGDFIRCVLNLKAFREKYGRLSRDMFNTLIDGVKNICGAKTSKGTLFTDILNWTSSMHGAFLKGIYAACGSICNIGTKSYLKLKISKGKDDHMLAKYIEDITGMVVYRDLRTYCNYLCFNYKKNAVTAYLNVAPTGAYYPFDDVGATVVGIREVRTRKAHSYDITTSSGTFDFSGLCSHNCRTRVMGNVYDPSNEICVGRGNLSFTTINLPRLGILAEKDINKFFELLDNRLDAVCNQLYERYLVQAKKRVINYPFLMGQGEWLGSDKLGLYDTVGEVLKQGTLGVGYIGLAECLVALVGKHHGESNEAWELGYSIIKHMREYCDKRAEETKMNYSVLMTPAEGLAGRFVRIDKKMFGIIPGVTDKDYYTNSSHIPVWYKITAARKIELEAPFHELANGGHICYIEVDGDPLNNLKAFEDIVRYMHDKGVGYGAINHAVDMDPVCGYIGIIGDECPRCHRREGEPMTIEMYNNIKGYMRKSSNFAFLGDMSENLQQLSDYKQ